MVDCRLERRPEHEPRRKPDCRSDEGGDRPDDGAVRQQHESQLLLGGTDGGEHAEMAEPPLCDDCEARSGDEGGKEQEDGGHGEHREHGRLRVVAPGDLGAREGRWGVLSTPEEGLERLVGRVDEDAHVVCGARGRGRDERELVTQLARVLDDPHDRPPLAVERQGRADFEPQKVGHAVRDGDLARLRRVAAPAEGEEDVSVGAARILRAIVHRLDAARDRDRAMRDDIGRPERSSSGDEACLETARIGAVERQHGIGRAEHGVVARRVGVVDDRDAADRGGDGDAEEGQHEELLPPLAPEEAQAPSGSPHGGRRLRRFSAAGAAR